MEKNCHFLLVLGDSVSIHYSNMACTGIIKKKIKPNSGHYRDHNIAAVSCVVVHNLKQWLHTFGGKCTVNQHQKALLEHPPM